MNPFRQTFEEREARRAQVQLIADNMAKLPIAVQTAVIKAMTKNIHAQQRERIAARKGKQGK